MTKAQAGTIINLNGAIHDVDGVELDFEHEFVIINGHQVHLTPTERAILDCLAQRVDRRIATADLARHLGLDVEDRAIQTTKSHVSNLRKKLKGLAPPQLKIAFQRRNLSYRLVVERGSD